MMMLTRGAVCLITLFGLATAPITVLAGPISVVGNLDEGSGFSQTIVPEGLTPPGSPPYWIAQEFNTGASDPRIVLSDIVASLGLFVQSNNNDFVLTAELDANASGNVPGAKIADLTQNGSLGVSSFNNVEFDPVGKVPLSPNTSYWFTLKAYSSDGSGSVDWQYASTDTPSSGTGFFSYYGYTTDGTIWSHIPVDPSLTPYLIQVDGVIPEPASLLLGSMGMLTVLAVSRRRKTLPAR